MVSKAGALVRWPRQAARGELLPYLSWTLSLAALSLLVFVAIVFAARRLAGGFPEPLGGAGLVAIAALLGGALIGIGRAERNRLGRGTEYSVLSTQYLALGTAAVSAAALLASVTFSDSP